MGFKIGELAALAGVTRDTLRFYEREGLLLPSHRTDARHRVYDVGSAARLRFIRSAQELGLTLDDIRALLALREERGARQCSRVRARLEARIAAVDEQLASLRLARRRLTAEARRCTGAEPCPVLERLEGAAEQPPG